MTVVVRQGAASVQSSVNVWIKGADNIILERCKPDRNVTVDTNQQLLSFAREGLRTLCFAEKKMVFVLKMMNVPLKMHDSCTFFNAIYIRGTMKITFFHEENMNSESKN